ncbi:trehalose-phosphatase [Brockia lithotrophica]|uniref:trehalose-phosphatase n=1 Tax=Brockia lithotrophica TaxID=933949 RepID=UPI000EB43DE5|nr:trehalose-phosphatase [Brockia lithotrophica]
MKLVIVANRLPYRVRPDGALELSPGGLVSGLLSFFRAAELQTDDYLWIGWPGNEGNEDPKLREALAHRRAFPVFLDAKAGMTKGSAARRFLRDQSFIFAAGDDVTDEDLFRALPETAIAVRVGAKPSHATYAVPTPQDLRKILEAFAVRS